LKIISGGQTGVDRAALDAALDLGLACGGWVPRGRKAEDGPLPWRYPLKETESRHYGRRTSLNVRDADATLVLSRGAPSGGTALTVKLADRLEKPCLVIDLEAPDPQAEAEAWLTARPLGVLNVAGPRESTAPGIYREASAFLRVLLSRTLSGAGLDGR
jgi:hypothetical protein